MKALVAGWFSFEKMGASAGDLIARDLVCRWLTEAGADYDVAIAPPFAGGVHWKSVDPRAYSRIVFVCGPFGNGWPVYEFLARFEGCRLVGVNLSMVEPLETWNPFDLLLERDSSREARADITFHADSPLVPVVGVILVHAQGEYREKSMHSVANAAIQRLIDARPMAAVPIDTRLDRNATGLRRADEVESVIARMDLVLTTRLHGMVLALKHGVPAIAVDPIAGGAKILRQAQTIGWPVAFTADTVRGEELEEAFTYCRTPAAREQARTCCQRARQSIQKVRDRFLQDLGEAC